MITLGFKIGFLEFGLLDLVDVFVVSLIIYQLYRLLKGSLALNIFAGFLAIFFTWYIVRALDMKLLSGILGQIFGVGAIAMIIVFQPELRRVLLFIGRGNIVSRSLLLQRLVQGDGGENLVKMGEIEEVMQAVRFLSQRSMGAIIVFPRSSKIRMIAETGVTINAKISAKLLQSIFFKNSPLHDGATIIAKGKIQAAGCILPVSDKSKFAENIGLRHRAALGITEQSDAYSIVVSEETGTISMADGGQLEFNLSLEELENRLTRELKDY